MSVDIKVGQKYRVVNAEGFSCPIGSVEGDILTIVDERSGISPNDVIWRANNETGASRELTIVHYTDITEGYIELVSDVVEDTQEGGSANTQDSSENVSDASTGSSSDMFEDMLGASAYLKESHGEILWKMIEASPTYNGHSQMEITDMSFDVLKSLVGILSDSCESVHNLLHIRLYIEGGGSASVGVFQDGFWGEGEHPSGHRDRLLFSVNKVTGV